MQIYLVGGAIRDQLLGYPVVERDWVVVGSCAEELLAAGYRQVGRDFPVFLHPNTHEEYALARIERKQGPGYRGFHCEATPQVRLDDDLRRRDLTINAMAMDEQGQLIDPYHGRVDLQRRQLRHVSDAFREDPVRVLRVARFMARYAHRQFTLAPETLHCMRDMAKQGELAHLVPERVWQEWHKSLSEKNPEAFLITLAQCHALPIILPELASLGEAPIHLLKTASLLSTDPLIRMAALLFSLPNAKTVETLGARLRIPSQTVQLALLLRSTHDAIMHLNQRQAVDVLNVFITADAFRRPERFEKLLLLCDVLALCYDHERIYTPGWRQILQACRQIKAHRELDALDDGLLIQQKLHQARINCIIPLLDFE